MAPSARSTAAVSTAMTLALDPLPPRLGALVAARALGLGYHLLAPLDPRFKPTEYGSAAPHRARPAPCARPGSARFDHAVPCCCSMASISRAASRRHFPSASRPRRTGP